MSLLLEICVITFSLISVLSWLSIGNQATSVLLYQEVMGGSIPLMAMVWLGPFLSQLAMQCWMVFLKVGSARW